MSKQQLETVATFYKDKSVINDLTLNGGVNVSAFASLLSGENKGTEMDLYEKLSYLAGIKNGPMLNDELNLNTNSIQDLILSAREAGYEVEVYSA